MSTQERGPRALGRKIADRLRIGKRERTVTVSHERLQDFNDLDIRFFPLTGEVNPAVFTLFIQHPEDPEHYKMRKLSIDLDGKRMGKDRLFQITVMQARIYDKGAIRDENNSDVSKMEALRKIAWIAQAESHIADSPDPRDKAQRGAIAMAEYKGAKKQTFEDVFNLTVDKLGYDLQEKRGAEKTKHF